MLVPLLLLWPLSVALTWLISQNIANKPHDRELEYLVQALARELVRAPEEGATATPRVRSWWSRLPWLRGTPLGWPVVPEV